MLDISIRRDVSLADRTTLGVGGPAWGWALFRTAEEVAHLAEVAERAGRPLVILGGGSNIVVADAGLGALVAQPAARGYALTRQNEGTVVRVDAGMDWDTFVAAMADRGLAGIEALSGIPGLAGGAPIQNIGAYGQELADTLVDVTVWDSTAAEVRVLSRECCGFGYRTSRFKGPDRGRFVVLELSLRLLSARPTVRYAELERELRNLPDEPRAALREVRRSVLAIRRRKSMVYDPSDPNHRSVGSFFVNPVVRLEEADAIDARCHRVSDRPMPRFRQPDGWVKLSAAWLIEQAGFAKGYARGKVGLSTRHALAIVNRGGATAADVIELARRIQDTVGESFGVRLRPEPQLLGFGSPSDALFGEPDVTG